MLFYFVSNSTDCVCLMYLDIDECAEGTGACARNADCVNEEGRYTCQCKAGFVGRGKVLCEGEAASFVFQ